MHDTFPANDQTYAHNNDTFQRYYDRKRAYYRRQGVERLAKWKSGARTLFPYAYILYKRKDKYRTRPIVSCKREPNSKHQKLAARAANFVVQELTANGESFTLWKVTDLAANVQAEMEDSNR